MMLDLEKVTRALKAFAKKHHTEFSNISRREAQALEIAALVLAVEHYRRHGYTVSTRNLVNGTFKLKLTARGYPWNFSWYSISKENRHFEIHANLAVKSATPLDEGTYVVDVGVVRSGSVPQAELTLEQRKSWAGVDNDALRTFIEAKKLVIYPMLLAQFFGIAHEIMPEFLDPSLQKDNTGHFYPALVSIGYLKGTSEKIVVGFQERGFRLNILPHFDTTVSSLSRNESSPSPFRPSAGEEAEDGDP